VEANLSRAVGHSEEISHFTLRQVRPVSGEKQSSVALGELGQRPAHVDGEGDVCIGRGGGGPAAVSSDCARGGPRSRYASRRAMAATHACGCSGVRHLAWCRHALIAASWAASSAAALGPRMRRASTQHVVRTDSQSQLPGSSPREPR
jgi:hypothetical protein